MSALSNHVSVSRDIVSLWQQRRNNAAKVWRDSQWLKFERVCNEEIKALLHKNYTNTEALDQALTSALNML